MIISILPSRSSITCSAFVVLGLPDALALGAAIGIPASFISLLAIGCDGIRIATVSSPPVVSFGTLSDLKSIMVSGPGQNLSARALALPGMSFTKGVISSKLDICTISGLSDGLPFAAYILADAVLS